MAARRDPLRIQRGTASLWLTLVVAISLAGCRDGGPFVTDDGPDIEVAPAGVAVSEPIGGAETGGGLAGGSVGLVYVSADPGTFADGVSATVANSATQGSVTAEIVDGGFDPVAIAGSPGEELEISITYGDGSSIRYRIIVPPRKRPRVVRTRPSKDAVDIPLNANIVVVFSEPVDEGTVTLESVKLLLDGAPVTATLTLDDPGLQAELVPGQPFQPETTYTLEIRQDIADLTGDVLEGAVTVSFTTLPALSGQIVFVSADVDYDSPVDWSRAEIYVVNADGSGLANLTNHPARDWQPAVSPDGTRILFTSDRDGNDEIYVMNADGSGLVNLTNHPALEYSAHWSPDGTRFLFGSDRDGNDEIYVMNADGSGLVNLTNDPDWDGAPIWSPDGTEIAFTSFRDSQLGCGGGTSPVAWPCPDIFVMNADGSSPVNLSNYPTERDSDPAWSPDGTKIAFASQRDGAYTEVYVTNPDGSSMVKLTDIEGPMRYAFAPAWSPDDTKIAFVGGPADNPMWVMNADGSNPIRLTDPVFIQQAIWSPDGSGIVFSMLGSWPGCGWSGEEERSPDDCYTRDVWVMNPDGSNKVNVTNSPWVEDRPVAWIPQR